MQHIFPTSVSQCRRADALIGSKAQQCRICVYIYIYTNVECTALPTCTLLRTVYNAQQPRLQQFHTAAVHCSTTLPPE